MAEKFYEKFNKKSSVAKAKNERKEFNRSRDEYFERKREKKDRDDFSADSKGARDDRFSDGRKAGRPGESRGASGDRTSSGSRDAFIKGVEKPFLLERIPRDARNVLENFDTIIQGVRPLNSKQIAKLPKDIRMLSHLLTDERESRRAGYMNANEELSAYVRYFTWWNLVRLTRVFASLPANAFNLKDGDYCLDMGSGPLTAVIALWLSRPELREKNLTWYCMDLSSSTMALGEDVYLSCASKTPPKNEKALPHWNIIRIKGSVGTPIRNKASLVVAANMFNEMSQNLSGSDAVETLADSQMQELLNYSTQDSSSVFIAEPGMPQAAHFVSLMRGRFLKNAFSIVSPCPHASECPMGGYHARYGGNVKWCNFDFQTEDAPARLLKLSKEAGLPKERAVISFVFAKKDKNATTGEGVSAGAGAISTSSGKAAATNNKSPRAAARSDSSLSVRIASDMIHLPGRGAGYYACSEKGLMLVVNSSGKQLESGDLLTLEAASPSVQKDIREGKLPRDKKSGALELRV